LSTHHRNKAKLQKAKTTPLLYFPGKDVQNLVLNKKDLLWRISRKLARFSQQANTVPWLLMCDYFQLVMRICVSFQDIVLLSGELFRGTS